MDTFYWVPREGMQISMQPTTRVVKFGDGYEQRSASGLNGQLMSCSPVFRVQDKAGVIALEDFLARHKGYIAFWWRSPLTHQNIRVVCRKWSVSLNAAYADFSCDFDEVAL